MQLHHDPPECRLLHCICRISDCIDVNPPWEVLRVQAVCTAYIGVDIPGRAASVARFRDLPEPFCNGGKFYACVLSLCMPAPYFFLRHSFAASSRLTVHTFKPLVFARRSFLSSLCGKCPLRGTERVPVRGGGTENDRATRRK